MTAGQTILIIDDEPQIQRFLKHSLIASGYHLLHAETAAAGLKAFAEHAPDIVVLDLGLPDLDGKAVIGQIRQTADTPYLRVFIGQLRQKVEADPSEPKLILTEPGVGYRAQAV